MIPTIRVCLNQDAYENCLPSLIGLLRCWIITVQIIADVLSGLV